MNDGDIIAYSFEHHYDLFTLVSLQNVLRLRGICVQKWNTRCLNYASRKKGTTLLLLVIFHPFTFLPCPRCFLNLGGRTKYRGHCIYKPELRQVISMLTRYEGRVNEREYSVNLRHPRKSENCVKKSTL